ncbi:MAG: PKD domain-containing protein, partial [Bacteroidota bacterium]
TYNFSDSCITEGHEGFEPEITIIFTRFCSAGMSRTYLKTPLLIKINPVAAIGVPSKLCKGQEACFTAQGCENADTATYKWYIDGTFAGTALEACNTFNTGGAHTVRLIMTNQCGADTVTQNIWVRDVPEAVSAFSFADTVGCIPTFVALDDQSSDYDVIYWKVMPSMGTMFIQSILVYPDTMLKITKADTYTIQHIAKNVCGADTSFHEITTHDVPGAVLDPAPAACDTLDYVPTVTWSGSIDTVKWYLDESLTYTFNAMQAPVFHLGTGTSSIELVVVGPCETAAVAQQVTVSASVEVTVEPLPSLCQSSEPVLLEASQSGVVFSGIGVSGNPLSGFLFDPAAPGVTSMNTVNYSLQGAGDCDASGSIQIEVLPGMPVSVPPPFKVCSDAGLQALSANPTGGEWSGEGVVGDTFNPSVGTGTHELTYRYLDPSGCVVVKTTTATVVEQPSLTAADTVTICLLDDDLTFQSLASLAVLPANSLLSCSGDGVNGSNCTFNPMTAGLGDHVIFVNATAASLPGCD